MSCTANPSGTPCYYIYKSRHIFWAIPTQLTQTMAGNSAKSVYKYNARITSRGGPDSSEWTGPTAMPTLTPYTWADKLESFERINSIRETNGNFDSCDSCKRLGTSRLHELHESKFPFVSRIEFMRSKLSNFSAHVYGVTEPGPTTVLNPIWLTARQHGLGWHDSVMSCRCHGTTVRRDRLAWLLPWLPSMTGFTFLFSVWYVTVWRWLAIPFDGIAWRIARHGHMRAVAWPDRLEGMTVTDCFARQLGLDYEPSELPYTNTQPTQRSWLLNMTGGPHRPYNPKQTASSEFQLNPTAHLVTYLKLRHRATPEFRGPQLWSPVLCSHEPHNPIPRPRVAEFSPFPSPAC